MPSGSSPSGGDSHAAGSTKATGYMPRPDQRHGTAIFDHPALTAVAATAEHMLAMMVKAARPAARQDVEALLLQATTAASPKSRLV